MLGRNHTAELIKVPMHKSVHGVVLTILMSSIMACQTEEAADNNDDVPECGSCDIFEEGVDDNKLCMAIRGNAHRISSHWGAIARAIEHYGPLYGMSGGSSGSITTFFAESIQMNPQIYACRENDGSARACETWEMAARTALLYKSLQGYVEQLWGTETGQAISVLAAVLQQIEERNIPELVEAGDDPSLVAASEALLEILSSDLLRDLINPEVIAMLREDDLATRCVHTQHIVDNLQIAFTFKPESDRVFFLPGIVNFHGLAERVGRVADLYAGYGPYDAASMDEFMEACAEAGLGMNWPEVVQLPAGDATCGELFQNIVQEYRTEMNANYNLYAHRLDDRIGQRMHVLTTVGVLVGDTAENFRVARQAYYETAEYEFEGRPEDLRAGNWGSATDLETIAGNPFGFQDLKTEIFYQLGPSTWREILYHSPAEPGLDRGHDLPDGSIAIGGWVDLHPVQSLRNMGCDTIIYVTRRMIEGERIPGVDDLVFLTTGFIGMSETDQYRMFDSSTPESSFGGALAEADGVWCTDWNSHDNLDVAGVAADAWNAPMGTQDELLLNSENPYPNAQTDLSIPGCVVGLAAE